MADTRCKGYVGHIETQEHCLSVCQSNMAAMKARHDKVMVSLVAMKCGRLGVDGTSNGVPPTKVLIKGAAFF